MEDFLSTAKAKLVDHDSFARVHIVIGNEACDLDSSVSAITYAYFLHTKHKDGDTVVLPVLNILESQFRLRTETTHFFKKLNIPPRNLIFKDQVDFNRLYSEERLVLTLVDHNVLTGTDTRFEDCVTEVIDHHVHERPEDDRVKIKLDFVGSCCTLVAEELLSDTDFRLDEITAELLYGTILVDTINRSPDAGKITPRDETVLSRLKAIIPNVMGDSLFEELQAAKFDISDLLNMEILEKDLKMVAGAAMTIAMSSVTMDMKALLARADFKSDLDEFCLQQKCQVVVIMTLVNDEDGKPARQIAVYSQNRIFRDQIADTLDNCEDVDLELEMDFAPFDDITVFQQGNIKASRKKVMPVLKSFLHGDVTPDVSSKDFITQHSVAAASEGFSHLEVGESENETEENESHVKFTIESIDAPSVEEEDNETGMDVRSYRNFDTVQLDSPGSVDASHTVHVQQTPAHDFDILITAGKNDNAQEVERNTQNLYSELASSSGLLSSAHSSNLFDLGLSDSELVDPFSSVEESAKPDSSENSPKEKLPSQSSESETKQSEETDMKSEEESENPKSDTRNPFIAELPAESIETKSEMSAQNSNPFLTDDSDNSNQLVNFQLNEVDDDSVLTDSFEEDDITNANVNSSNKFNADNFLDVTTLGYDHPLKKKSASLIVECDAKSQADDLAELEESELFDKIPTPETGHSGENSPFGLSGVNSPFINSYTGTPFHSRTTSDSGAGFLDSGAGFPDFVVPPNSVMDQGFGESDTDRRLPSFNNAEMVERIHKKKASLVAGQDILELGQDIGESSTPYTPQNSFREGGMFMHNISNNSLPDMMDSEMVEKVQQKRDSLSANLKSPDLDEHADVQSENTNPFGDFLDFTNTAVESNVPSTNPFSQMSIESSEFDPFAPIDPSSDSNGETVPSDSLDQDFMGNLTGFQPNKEDRSNVDILDIFGDSDNKGASNQLENQTGSQDLLDFDIQFGSQSVDTAPAESSNPFLADFEFTNSAEPNVTTSEVGQLSAETKDAQFDASFDIVDQSTLEALNESANLEAADAVSETLAKEIIHDAIETFPDISNPLVATEMIQRNEVDWTEQGSGDSGIGSTGSPQQGPKVQDGARRLNADYSVETEYLPSMDPLHGSLNIMVNSSRTQSVETDADKEVVEGESFRKVSGEGYDHFVPDESDAHNRTIPLENIPEELREMIIADNIKSASSAGETRVEQDVENDYAENEKLNMDTETLSFEEVSENVHEKSAESNVKGEMKDMDSEVLGDLSDFGDEIFKTTYSPELSDVIEHVKDGILQENIQSSAIDMNLSNSNNNLVGISGDLSETNLMKSLNLDFEGNFIGNSPNETVTNQELNVFETQTDQPLLDITDFSNISDKNDTGVDRTYESGLMFDIYGSETEKAKEEIEPDSFQNSGNKLTELQDFAVNKEYESEIGLESETGKPAGPTLSSDFGNARGAYLPEVSSDIESIQTFDTSVQDDDDRGIDNKGFEVDLSDVNIEKDSESMNEEEINDKKEEDKAEIPASKMELECMEVPEKTSSERKRSESDNSISSDSSNSFPTTSESESELITVRENPREETQPVVDDIDFIADEMAAADNIGESFTVETTVKETEVLTTGLEEEVNVVNIDDENKEPEDLYIDRSEKMVTDSSTVETIVKEKEVLTTGLEEEVNEVKIDNENKGPEVLYMDGSGKIVTESSTVETTVKETEVLTTGLEEEVNEVKIDNENKGPEVLYMDGSGKMVTESSTVETTVKETEVLTTGLEEEVNVVNIDDENKEPEVLYVDRSEKMVTASSTVETIVKEKEVLTTGLEEEVNVVNIDDENKEPEVLYIDRSEKMVTDSSTVETIVKEKEVLTTGLEEEVNVVNIDDENKEPEVLYMDVSGKMVTGLADITDIDFESQTDEDNEESHTQDLTDNLIMINQPMTESTLTVESVSSIETPGDEHAGGFYEVNPETIYGNSAEDLLTSSAFETNLGKNETGFYQVNQDEDALVQSSVTIDSVSSVESPEHEKVTGYYEVNAELLELAIDKVDKHYLKIDEDYSDASVSPLETPEAENGKGFYDINADKLEKAIERIESLDLNNSLMVESTFSDDSSISPMETPELENVGGFYDFDANNRDSTSVNIMEVEKTEDAIEKIPLGPSDAPEISIEFVESVGSSKDSFDSETEPSFELNDSKSMDEERKVNEDIEKEEVKCDQDVNAQSFTKMSDTQACSFDQENLSEDIDFTKVNENETVTEKQSGELEATPEITVEMLSSTDTVSSQGSAEEGFYEMNAEIQGTVLQNIEIGNAFSPIESPSEEVFNMEYEINPMVPDVSQDSSQSSDEEYAENRNKPFVRFCMDVNEKEVDDKVEEMADSLVETALAEAIGSLQEQKCDDKFRDIEKVDSENLGSGEGNTDSDTYFKIADELVNEAVTSAIELVQEMRLSEEEPFITSEIACAMRESSDSSDSDSSSTTTEGSYRIVNSVDFSPAATPDREEVASPDLEENKNNETQYETFEESDLVTPETFKRTTDKEESAIEKEYNENKKEIIDNEMETVAQPDVIGVDSEYINDENGNITEERMELDMNTDLVSDKIVTDQPQQLDDFEVNDQEEIRDQQDKPKAFERQETLIPDIVISTEETPPSSDENEFEPDKENKTEQVSYKVNEVNEINSESEVIDYGTELKDNVVEKQEIVDTETFTEEVNQDVSDHFDMGKDGFVELEDERVGSKAEVIDLTDDFKTDVWVEKQDVIQKELEADRITEENVNAFEHEANISRSVKETLPDILSFDELIEKQESIKLQSIENDEVDPESTTENENVERSCETSHEDENEFEPDKENKTEQVIEKMNEMKEYKSESEVIDNGNELKDNVVEKQESVDTETFTKDVNQDVSDQFDMGKDGFVELEDECVGSNAEVIDLTNDSKTDVLFEKQDVIQKEPEADQITEENVNAFEHEANISHSVKETLPDILSYDDLIEKQESIKLQSNENDKVDPESTTENENVERSCETSHEDENEFEPDKENKTEQVIEKMNEMKEYKSESEVIDNSNELKDNVVEKQESVDTETFTEDVNQDVTDQFDMGKDGFVEPEDERVGSNAEVIDLTDDSKTDVLFEKQDVIQKELDANQITEENVNAFEHEANISHSVKETLPDILSFDELIEKQESIKLQSNENDKVDPESTTENENVERSCETSHEDENEFEPDKENKTEQVIEKMNEMKEYKSESEVIDNGNELKDNVVEKQESVDTETFTKDVNQDVSDQFDMGKDGFVEPEDERVGSKAEVIDLTNDSKTVVLVEKQDVIQKEPEADQITEENVNAFEHEANVSHSVKETLPDILSFDDLIEKQESIKLQSNENDKVDSESTTENENVERSCETSHEDENEFEPDKENKTEQVIEKMNEMKEYKSESEVIDNGNELKDNVVEKQESVDTETFTKDVNRDVSDQFDMGKDGFVEPEDERVGSNAEVIDLTDDSKTDVLFEKQDVIQKELDANQITEENVNALENKANISHSVKETLPDILSFDELIEKQESIKLQSIENDKVDPESTTENENVERSCETNLEDVGNRNGVQKREEAPYHNIKDLEGEKDEKKSVRPNKGQAEYVTRKEIFYTSAGRMSISIDSVVDPPSDSELSYAGGQDIIHETHEAARVAHILARTGSAIYHADEVLSQDEDASLPLQQDTAQNLHADCINIVAAANDASDDASDDDDDDDTLSNNSQPVDDDDDVTSEKHVVIEKVEPEKPKPSHEKMKMDDTQEWHEDPIPGMGATTQDSSTEESDTESDSEYTKPPRPDSLLNGTRRKKKIAANNFLSPDSTDDLVEGVDDIPTPDDLETPSDIEAEGLEWEDDTPITPTSDSKKFSEYRDDEAEREKYENTKFRKVEIAGKDYRVDMKVIEPYKKVLSHGGYYGDGLNAIILFCGCYLPDRGRRDYQYVMDNLFLYVISTLELLVAEDYMIVYFHGATPRRQMPSFGWLKRCYQMIDRRLRKNLKALLMVHPTLWLKTVVMMTKPFISSKFSSKLRFVKTLQELGKIVPMEYIYVPDPVSHTERMLQTDPDYLEKWEKELEKKGQMETKKSKFSLFKKKK